MKSIHVTSMSGSLYFEDENGIIEESYDLANNKEFPFGFGDSSDVECDENDDVWSLLDRIEETYMN